MFLLPSNYSSNITFSYQKKFLQYSFCFFLMWYRISALKRIWKYDLRFWVVVPVPPSAPQSSLSKQKRGAAYMHLNCFIWSLIIFLSTFGWSWLSWAQPLKCEGCQSTHLKWQPDCILFFSEQPLVSMLATLRKHLCWNYSLPTVRNNIISNILVLNNYKRRFFSGDSLTKHPVRDIDFMFWHEDLLTGLWNLTFVLMGLDSVWFRFQRQSINLFFTFRLIFIMFLNYVFFVFCKIICSVSPYLAWKHLSLILY